jgi:hypothetical protein
MADGNEQRSIWRMAVWMSGPPLQAATGFTIEETP